MAKYTQLSEDEKNRGLLSGTLATLRDPLTNGVQNAVANATGNGTPTTENKNGILSGALGIIKDSLINGVQDVLANTAGNKSPATGNDNQTTQTPTQAAPQAAAPTYQGTYDQQLNELYQQIVNRDKFSYNINEDALYQQYVDQFTTQGKLAMQDAMGQAAAMTGGYGNSYAQSVGQQAYQGYLQQLNQVVPELYGMAYDQYRNEGQDLLNQYAMLGEMRDTEYMRYQDQLNQYWNERNFQYQQGQDEYNKLAELIVSTGYIPTAEEMAAAGMSEGQLKALQSYAGSQNATTATNIPDYVIERLQTYTTEADMMNYLDRLIEGGIINDDQAYELMMQYMPDSPDSQVGLQDRNWDLVDDGGINWFWGIDENAQVQDQYGNTYRMDDLVDLLIEEGMTKDEAKAYVKALQERLGA